MKTSTFLAAVLCLCVLLVTSWADAAVHRSRSRSTCTSGTCGQQTTAAPRVQRSSQTTRTTTTVVRRSR